jgi:hypothetical protein
MKLRIVRNNDSPKGSKMRLPSASSLSASLICIAALQMAVTPVYAEEIAADDNDPRTIVVTGTSDGYAASNSVTATRSVCAGKTPPPISFWTACAMTCNIFAGFII